MIEPDFDFVRCSRPLTKRGTMSSNNHKDDDDFEFTVTVRGKLIKLLHALVLAVILILIMNADDPRSESMRTLPLWFDKLRAYAP